MTTERANPFGNLDDFAPTPKEKRSARPNQTIIETIAQENQFSSRPALPHMPRSELRRRRTGRNQQLNIKATSETIARFYRLADAENLPLGELLERALEAYETQS